MIHMVLLWALAILELISFPLLGAGTQVFGGYKLLTIEGYLFGVMTMGIVLTLRVVGELWRPAVDNVVKVMVWGLEQELPVEARMAGTTINAQRRNYPQPKCCHLEEQTNVNKEIINTRNHYFPNNPVVEKNIVQIENVVFLESIVLMMVDSGI
jgi:hypothetical protein